MKRLHLHTTVRDLEQSIQFYSTLFGQEPARREADYAKWMLEDPRVNFAISTWGQKPGIDHLGLQVDDEAELQDIAQRLTSAGLAVKPETGTTCCYAVSDKHWVVDPAGTPWETFRTMAQAKTRGASQAKTEVEAKAKVEAAALCAEKLQATEQAAAQGRASVCCA